MAETVITTEASTVIVSEPISSVLLTSGLGERGPKGDPGLPGTGSPGAEGPAGPAGPSGADGQPRFTGEGPPPDVIVGARPGDAYLDTTTGGIYRLF